MKKLSLFLFLIATSLFVTAQSEPNCHEKYVRVFEVRGAETVKDGMHEDVVITLRKGSFADCFIGKVAVKNGMIDKNSLALTFVDGSYEKLDRAYKSKDPVGIINGMSETMVTKAEELINVMFVGAVKPKKKAYKRAPEPDFNL